MTRRSCERRRLPVLAALAAAIAAATAWAEERSLVEQLEGASYYDTTPTTCRANAPGRPTVKSWTDRIQFHKGRVLVWGTICNDNPVLQEFRPAEFGFNPDLSALTHRGRTFHRRDRMPALCEGGQWCPE